MEKAFDDYRAVAERRARRFRWFVRGALTWALIWSACGIAAVVILFNIVGYLDDARARRDGRDALQEYAACAALADTGGQPMTNGQAKAFDLLNCETALSKPVPGPVATDGKPSPNPSPTAAFTPSPQVSLVPTTIPSAPSSLRSSTAAPTAVNSASPPSTGVPVAPSTVVTTATASSTATVTVSPAPASPSPTCAVSLLGICLIS